MLVYLFRRSIISISRNVILVFKCEPAYTGAYLVLQKQLSVFMTYPVYQYLLVDHIWMLLILQIIFSEVPVLMLLCQIVEHLYGCFSCFRGLFQ